MKTLIPKKFIERYKDVVDDTAKFREYLSKPLPRAFRVNTIKVDIPRTIKSLESYGLEIKRVPWSGNSFITNDKRLGSTIEHFMGYIYIQELVSMLPPIVLEKELAKNAEAKVLDACAAPGSKTTQLSAIMGNKGLIVANDSSFGRIKILKHNLEKSGCMNVVTINKDTRFLNLGMEFDFVLLDAVCSSEGIIRKNPNVFSHWNEKRILSIARTQKQMILKSYEMLRPGGVLVYSTCTFAPEENESVINYLLGKKPGKLEKIKLEGLETSDPVSNWKGEEFDKDIAKAVRIWPHHNDTGGFFMAKIRRES